MLASPELLLASERLFVVECERFGWRRERELRLGWWILEYFCQYRVPACHSTCVWFVFVYLLVIDWNMQVCFGLCWDRWWSGVLVGQLFGSECRGCCWMANVIGRCICSGLVPKCATMWVEFWWNAGRLPVRVWSAAIRAFFAVFLSASSRAGWWNRVLGGVWGQTEVGLHFVVPFPAQSLELRSSTCSCMCKQYWAIILHYMRWMWGWVWGVVGGVWVGFGCVFGGLEVTVWDCFIASFWL